MSHTPLIYTKRCNFGPQSNATDWPEYGRQVNITENCLLLSCARSNRLLCAS